MRTARSLPLLRSMLACKSNTEAREAPAEAPPGDAANTGAFFFVSRCAGGSDVKCHCAGRNESLCFISMRLGMLGVAGERKRLRKGGRKVGRKEGFGGEKV